MMLPGDIHPMALAMGALASVALVGFAIQFLWLFVIIPLCRWIGGR